jgi:hypothetical protein
MSFSTELATIESGVTAFEAQVPAYLAKAKEALNVLKEVDVFLSLVNPALGATVGTVITGVGDAINAVEPEVPVFPNVYSG